MPFQAPIVVVRLFPPPTVADDASDGIVTGVVATATASCDAGVPNIAIDGAQATATGAASAGTPKVAVDGTQAAATAAGQVGTPKIAVDGTQATATAAGQVGTPKIAITGTQAAATASCTAGTPTSSITGAQATSTASCSAGTPKISIDGSQAAASASGSAGTISGTVSFQLVPQTPGVLTVSPAAVGSLTLNAATAGTLELRPPYRAEVMADSPRGYWKLDELSGNFTDATGNGHTGTANGGIVYGAAGAVGTGITLDGSSGYISVPYHADFDFGDVFTIEAWVNLRATGSFQVVVDKGNSAYRLDIVVATGKFRLLKVGFGAAIVQSTVGIPFGSWHYVVLTKDGSTVKQYLDAVDVTGTVTDQTLGNNNGTMGIGARLDGSPAAVFLSGGLDEVALYPTALTAARVAAHYHAVAGSTLLTPQTPGSLTLTPA